MPLAQFSALLSMLLAMATYQVSASLAKQLMLQLAPLTVVTLRLCFAAILVLVILRSWRIFKRLPYLKWRPLLAYSASLGAMNLLFYSSLGKLPQGVAVALEFVGPLGLAFLSLKQRRDVIWIVLAVVGIVLLLPWQTGLQAPLSLVGSAYALGAGLCWALYIYFGHQVVRQRVGIHALSIAICLSALCFLPLSLVVHPEQTMNVVWWPQALLLALLATVIPYALDLFALKRLSKVQYGTLSSLAPALAVLAGFILLNEQILLLQAVAVACIVLASVGISYRRAS